MHGWAFVKTSNHAANHAPSWGYLGPRLLLLPHLLLPHPLLPHLLPHLLLHLLLHLPPLRPLGRRVTTSSSPASACLMKSAANRTSRAG